MTEEQATDTPIGLCNTCGHEMGEIDGTWRTAVCEPCARADTLLQRAARRLAWALRDALRPLCEGIEGMRAVLQRGRMTLSLRVTCAACGAQVTASVEEPGLVSHEGMLVEQLRTLAPGWCPRCGRRMEAGIDDDDRG